MNISASTLKAQHDQARKQFPFIDEQERSHGLLPFLLYAVGSRETNLRNIAGDFSQRKGEPAPRFHGFGIWQRDSGAFGVGPEYLKDVRKQARQAAELLVANFATFKRWDAAVAAYNCGPGNVRRALQQGRPVDAFTTGHDYSADVLARRLSLVASIAAPAVVGPPVPVVAPPAKVHVVVKGDTLSEIAQRFHTTVDKLAKLNHIPDPDLIFVGQHLKLSA